MADPTDSGIYEIVNLNTGKRYIGSAKSFRDRWYGHRRELNLGKHHSRHLQRAWTKHGGAAFVFRVLELCEISDLIAREQVAIDSLRPAYNISRTAGSTLGVKYTAEGRANVSAALMGKRKGMPRSPGAVAKTAAAHRGMKRSEETRAKIAAAARGRRVGARSAEYRAKISAAHKGRPKSLEHIEALQAGRRAHVLTAEQKAGISEGLRRAYADGRRSRERPPEYRAKITVSLTGRKATPEHRANLSAAQRGKKRGPYNLDPAKAEARRAAGKRLAAEINKKRWGWEG